MPHIALLGDSIFDNASYTAGEPDVVRHLRTLLPKPWRASLHAVDGSVTRELAAQKEGLPAEASHVVVSIGGNDALHNSDLLDTPVRSTAEALALFGERANVFEGDYRAAIQEAVSLERETAVCTIYNGNLEPAELAALGRVALMTFNDVILRVAFEFNLKVIDLRYICNQPEDYTNSIEPSGRGGRKIAEAIAHVCGAVGAPKVSEVYVG